MKKLFFSVCILGSSLFLSQCGNPTKEKLQGIWRVEEVDLNGTVMDATSFGSWMWEFNEEGGYMVNLSGAKVKGTYTAKDKKLTLKPEAEKEQEASVYDIDTLTDKEMQLTTLSSTKNKSTLRFIKTEKGMEETD